MVLCRNNQSWITIKGLRMSAYEIIIALISLLAVIVSFVALYRSRQTQKKLVEFEKIHVRLSELQIEEHHTKAKQAELADLKVVLTRNREGYRFVVSNQGLAVANNIFFQIDGDISYNPIVQGQLDQKIPFPSLLPEDSFFLLASVPINIKQDFFPILVTWNNEDGSKGRKSFSVCRDAA